jgi:hypothetical protein
MADAVYNDDPSIPDGAELWRRINPAWWIRDKNRAIVRPTSQAFQNSSDGSPMSVLIADIVLESGRKPADILPDDTYSLVSFTAGLARECNQAVCRDPKPDEAHALVAGEKTPRVKERLALGSRWIIEPRP